MSFTVGRGEIVGLLGPNGAGKTTTINMILGVLEATGGSVTIDGIDIAKDRARALKRTNFAAVYASLPGNLTVGENLRFFGLLYGIRSLKRRIEQLLAEFDLVHLRDTKCGLLSSGEQTRAALAKALINEPTLLLLDEPTASLDPSAALTIRERIVELASRDGCGILWTSHNMLEVQSVCDRVLFLSRGKVLLEGDPIALPEAHGASSLEELFIRVAREPLDSDLSMSGTSPHNKHRHRDRHRDQHRDQHRRGHGRGRGHDAMKARPIAAIVLRQFFLLRGSPVRLFGSVVWVTIDIVLWGFITRYLNTISGSGVNFVPTLLGAVLLWDFCERVMQGVGTAFLEDVWSRNLLNLFSSPLSISEYVTGLVLTSVMTSSLGLVMMLIVALGIFHLELFSQGLPLAAFVLLLFVFGITLGIVATAMVLRFGPASEWLMWPLAALLSPFAAVFYPVTVLPTWMQWIAHALPPSYVFEGMRSLLAGNGFPGGLLLRGAAVAALELLAAAYVYGHVYRRAVRTGLLARYSAEGAT